MIMLERSQQNNTFVELQMNAHLLFEWMSEELLREAHIRSRQAGKAIVSAVSSSHSWYFDFLRESLQKNHRRLLRTSHDSYSLLHWKNPILCTAVPFPNKINLNREKSNFKKSPQSLCRCSVRACLLTGRLIFSSIYAYYMRTYL